MPRPKQYAKRSNIDCSILVKEIETRPELWDARNPSRHNRVSLHENWNEIGHILDQPGKNNINVFMQNFINNIILAEICRKKWKYIKDQYRKELRMEMRCGPSYFKSNWSLYESLNFMKPYFKTLLVGHTKRERNHFIEQNEIKSESNYENLDVDPENASVDMEMHSESDECDEEMENWKFSCRLSNNELSVVEITEDDNDSAVVLSEHGKPSVKKIRLSRIGSIESSSVSENSRCNDDNLHFFKSLLPFMTKLDDLQKLRVRSTIQNVILHELEGTSKS